jgi:vitamin B12 transporter
MRTPRSFLAATGLSLVAIHAFAEDVAPEPVVISATQVPTPESQIASSVTVITGEDIELKQQRTLPDVLRNVPGLNVVQTGGPGGQTSVFIRGTNLNHTKVFVDGIDVSDPSSPNASFDFAQFLTQDIAQVEILRGPQSGLYGSDAIGGVINIITQNGTGPTRLRGSIEGGSFDTFNQTGSINGSADQFHYSANIEHFHSGETPVTPLNLLLPAERRNDDYYDNLTASTKLGYDVLRGFDLGMVARYSDTHLRNTGDDFSNFPDPSFPAREQTASNTSEYYARAFAHSAAFDGAFDQTLGVAYTRKRTAIFEPDFPLSLDAGERTKVDWRGAIKLATSETVVLGAEHSRDAISQPLSASIRINSGYGELQSQLGENFFSAVNVRYDDNSLFGGKATYRVAPLYRFSATGTRIKASVGSGFKAPTLSELFQDFPPFFFANPHLQPETSVGYDIGLEQSLIEDVVSTGATYFHNRLRNLITTDETGISYANIGRATTEGIESFVAYQPLKTLSLRADYTYTQATDDVLHQELLRRPRHKVSIDANWRATPELSLDATVLTVSSWVDGNRDFSIPRLDAPGYTIVNLSGSYDINANLAVFARVDNLFDRHYQNPTGFLQPSLGAFAGIKAKLDRRH